MQQFKKNYYSRSSPLSLRMNGKGRSYGFKDGSKFTKLHYKIFYYETFKKSAELDTFFATKHLKDMQGHAN